jgi:DNA-binding transcriptional ArsR family regulator
MSVYRKPILTDAFEALGDPQRRTILQLLGERPRAVGELADELPVSRPAVSFHLRLLKDAGLVEERRQGTRRIYSLRAAGLEAVETYLREVWGDAAIRFRMMAENTKGRR